MHATGKKKKKKKADFPRTKNKTNPNHSNLSLDKTIASKLSRHEYLFEINFIFFTKLPEYITIK